MNQRETFEPATPTAFAVVRHAKAVAKRLGELTALSC
jgi:hypothetical protein